MHLYEVGKPFSGTRSSWPERGLYGYASGRHELQLFLRRPSLDEIDAVRMGSAEFALVVEPPVIVFLYRFGIRIPWADAPFSAHLLPAEQRTVPPVLQGPERALLNIILVDAATGIVRALRAITLSPAFSRTLHGAIQEQLQQPWEPVVFDAELARLYARYPETERLLAIAAARTK